MNSYNQKFKAQFGSLAIITINDVRLSQFYRIKLRDQTLFSIKIRYLVKIIIEIVQF